MHSGLSLAFVYLKEMAICLLIQCKSFSNSKECNITVAQNGTGNTETVFNKSLF